MGQTRAREVVHKWINDWRDASLKKKRELFLWEHSSIFCETSSFIIYLPILLIYKKKIYILFKHQKKSLSVQFSSVPQSCPTLCDPMNRSTPSLPVHHQRPEFTQTHVHPVSDAIRPSHPLSSPSPPAPNPSQHQSLFQWVNSLNEVAKVLEFQL